MQFVYLVDCVVIFDNFIELGNYFPHKLLLGVGVSKKRALSTRMVPLGARSPNSKIIYKKHDHECWIDWSFCVNAALAVYRSHNGE